MVASMSYGLLHRWTTSARSSVVDQRHGPARRTFQVSDIEKGWLVLDNGGQRLGTVAGSDDDVVSVSRGFLSPRLLIPRTAIKEVHEGVLRLNVSAAWIETRGWDGPRRRTGR